MAGAFRSDIEGLRALAILLVVLFHAEVPGFGGGFIGVDVFFVVSGFLITRKLAEELTAAGSIDLIRFWLGRAKRLLPAASAMIATTLVVQMLTRNPLHWQDAINETWAAAFYFSNEAIARTPAGYFDATRVERALLHTWSLSVEEQFYFAWPLMLSVFVGANLKRARVLVGGTAAASLVLCAVLTIGESPLAYLSASSRAWEFLAGAAIGLPSVLDAIRRRLSPSAQGVAAIGLLSIIVSGFVITEGTRFPYPTALVPVIGTVLVIVASVDEGSMLGKAFAFRPMQQIGKLSYSWYLWHWPVLVLGKEVLGNDHLALRVGLVAAALVPAVISFTLIESPIRRLRTPTLPRSALVSLAIPSLVVVGVLLVATDRDNSEFAPPEALALRDARTDWPAQFLACSFPDIATLEANCIGGDESSSTTALLLGDSHAAHWFSALDHVGDATGVRLVAMHQGNCPATVLRDLASLSADCRLFADELDVVLDHFDPAVIVLSHADVYAPEAPDDWRSGLEQLASELDQDGRTLLLIHDVPRFPFDPNLCLAEQGAAAEESDAACSLSRRAAEERAAPIRSAEYDVVAEHDNVFGWDPFDHLCTSTSCPPRIDGDVVYLDPHHITVNFSRSLGPLLEAPVTRALAAGGSMP